MRDGRVHAVGPRRTVEVPAGAERVDLAGRTVIPGLVNAHGHVGETRGLRSGPELNTAENVREQLALYARYESNPPASGPHYPVWARWEEHLAVARRNRAPESLCDQGTRP